MKKVLVLFIVLVLGVICYGQSTTPKEAQRSNGGNTLVDPRLKATLNLVIPHYPDTATANLTANKGNDSLSAIMHTLNDNKFWIRGKVGSSKRWYEVGGSSVGAGSGLTLSGSNLDLGGFLTKSTDLTFEDAITSDRFNIKLSGAGNDFWSLYNQTRKFITLGTSDNGTGDGAAIVVTDTSFITANGVPFRQHSAGFENKISSVKNQFLKLDSNGIYGYADTVKFNSSNVYFNGIASGLGNKVIRYNSTTGQISYADTS